MGTEWEADGTIHTISGAEHETVVQFSVKQVWLSIQNKRKQCFLLKMLHKRGQG
jgi:hypothetical protein